MQKKWLSLLLCCLLLASPGFCSAATYTVTEAELMQLEQTFAELKSTNNVLMSGSDASKLDLIRALKLLKESQEQLKKLQEQLATLKAESTMARSDLSQASESLKAANQSLETFAKEQKAIQSRLKTEKIVWQLAAAVATYFAVTK